MPVVTLPAATAIVVTSATTVASSVVPFTAVASPTPTALPATGTPAMGAVTVTIAPAPLVSAVPTAVLTPAPTAQPPSAMAATKPASSGVVSPAATVTLLRPQTATPVFPTVPANLMAAIEAARASNLPGNSSMTLLMTGAEAVSANGTQAIYAASTIKLPIYLTLAHRIKTGEAAFTWNTPITVRSEDIVGGTGVLQQMSGRTLPVQGGGTPDDRRER